MNMAAITIYHNPGCGTSRNTLTLMRNTGTELGLNGYGYRW